MNIAALIIKAAGIQ